MIIQISMVFNVNYQISVIITGHPGIYVNVCHVTSMKNHSVKMQDLTDLFGSPGKEITCK